MTDIEGDALLQFSFEATVIYWRGPSPFFYAPLPPESAAKIRPVLKAVTYGWGMVPAEARIGDVVFTTALFPKDETYLLPIKAAVRKKANVTAGDLICVEMILRSAER